MTQERIRVASLLTSGNDDACKRPDFTPKRMTLAQGGQLRLRICCPEYTYLLQWMLYRSDLQSQPLSRSHHGGGLPPRDYLDSLLTIEAVVPTPRSRLRLGKRKCIYDIAGAFSAYEPAYQYLTRRLSRFPKSRLHSTARIQWPTSCRSMRHFPHWVSASLPILFRP